MFPEHIMFSFAFGPTMMLPLLGTPLPVTPPHSQFLFPPTLHSFFRFQRSLLPSRILPWTTSSKLGCLSPKKKNQPYHPCADDPKYSTKLLSCLSVLPPPCNMYVHTHIHTFTYTDTDYKLLLGQDIASSIFWRTQYKHNIFIEWIHYHKKVIFFRWLH